MGERDFEEIIGSMAPPELIDRERLRLLSSFETRCPACGREGFTLKMFLYDMPRVGKTILVVGRCDHCGYTYKDIRLAESRGKQRIVIKVSNLKDLNRIVLKSSSASIKIPELGLEMSPGPASEGFITTIEGILLRFKDVTLVLCRDSSGKKKEICEKKLKEISDAINGEKEFTVIIEDPEGVSAVLE